MSEKIIDEVMRLVEAYKDTAISGYSGWEESAAIRAKLREVLERNPLTDSQIEKLREQTFSTSNPYCPCDSKTMRKAVQAAERAHNIGADA